MKIKQLHQTIINQIKAGEVIDRPASVIKELVENAIDAGASKVEVTVRNGGRNLIIVEDDGEGMCRDDLALSIKSHTTSKLNDDIHDIQHFGFRGEALASICSISRATITSKHISEECAWQIEVEGGNEASVIPAARNKGTKLEIRDLFYATPARLKFLKSERSELSHIVDLIEKIAMANPNVALTLSNENKTLLNLPASSFKQRIQDVMGAEFMANATEMNFQNEFIKIFGFTSLPTYNKATSTSQYLFVNSRPVRDKMLASSIRVAYQDVLARDRYPVSVIFIEVGNEEVDVNVHPSKVEVRFRDSNIIASAVRRALKDSVATGGFRVSSANSEATFNKFIPDLHIPKTKEFTFNDSRKTSSNFVSYSAPKREMPQYEEFKAPAASIVEEEIAPCATEMLGHAIAQVANTYVISETEDSVIIIDQHAAHERIVYEQLKTNYFQGKIPTQRLLIKEIIEFDDVHLDLFKASQEELAKFGFVYEVIGKNLIVNQVPLLIANSIDVEKFAKDIADELLEYGTNLSLTEKTEHILETFACHHSIRAGRKMQISEINDLLRAMESTPFSGQCNHGRPTYIKLQKNDIDRLFGRS